MAIRFSGLKDRPRFLRGPISRGVSSAPGAIDREGGAFGNGVIHGVSIIERGVAAGHGFWVDSTMLKQTRTAINAAAQGIKVHFTHGGMSGDGLGDGLGRIQSSTLSGDKVIADLHFWESADREKVRQVITRAEEDPSAFGMSIAFAPDAAAEKKFVEDHGGKYIIDEDGYAYVKNFKSPDPLNVDNLPHARIAELAAADAVDDPAATSGMFSEKNGFLDEMDALFAYAFGLSRTAPDTVGMFGIHPERIKGYARRWLERNGLNLSGGATWRQRRNARAIEMDKNIK